MTTKKELEAWLIEVELWLGKTKESISAMDDSSNPPPINPPPPPPKG